MKQPFLEAGCSRRVLLCRTAGAGALLLATLPVAATAEPVTTEVKIDNFVFQPNLLRVKPGTMVTWVNRDDIPHSIVVADLQVHSHPMDTDERFSYRFTQVGTFEYRCGLHPHMHGTVVVG